MVKAVSPQIKTSGWMMTWNLLRVYGRQLIFFLGVGRWERSGGVAHQLTRFSDAGDFYQSLNSCLTRARDRASDEIFALPRRLAL